MEGDTLTVLLEISESDLKSESHRYSAILQLYRVSLTAIVLFVQGAKRAKQIPART